jgi:hypothetical protein
MRKTAGYFVFLFSVLVFLTAMNQTFINRIKKDRYFDHLNAPGAFNRTLYYRVFVRSDKWRYGDLYGVSYLPEYKFPLEPFSRYEKKNAPPPTGRSLYIIGDSYLADKTMDGAFRDFDEVVFLDRRFPFGPIRLDSTRQNYLIMEFAERNLNDYALSTTAEKRWTPAQLRAKINFSGQAENMQGETNLPTGIADRLNRALFNKDLSRNLELLLFDDRFFSPFKQFKAYLNYKYLGRVAKEVAVSTDKRRLLMNITVDTSYRQSVFREVDDRELSRLTGNLNTAQAYYRSIGFKKVILSVIPNAVSVYDARRMPYNHLLERVEKNNLFPVLSLWKAFKSSNSNLYYQSDTHWNPRGLDLWINTVNKAGNTW